MDDETRSYLRRNGIDPDGTTTDENGETIPLLDETGRISRAAYRAIANREIDLINESAEFQRRRQLEMIAESESCAAETRPDPPPGITIKDPRAARFLVEIAAVIAQVRAALR